MKTKKKIFAKNGTLFFPEFKQTPTLRCTPESNYWKACRCRPYSNFWGGCSQIIGRIYFPLFFPGFGTPAYIYHIRLQINSRILIMHDSTARHRFWPSFSAIKLAPFLLQYADKCQLTPFAVWSIPQHPIVSLIDRGRGVARDEAVQSIRPDPSIKQVLQGADPALKPLQSEVVVGPDSPCKTLNIYLFFPSRLNITNVQYRLLKTTFKEFWWAATHMKSLVRQA